MSNYVNSRLAITRTCQREPGVSCIVIMIMLRKTGTIKYQFDPARPRALLRAQDRDVIKTIREVIKSRI